LKAIELPVAVDNCRPSSARIQSLEIRLGRMTIAVMASAATPRRQRMKRRIAFSRLRKLLIRYRFPESTISQMSSRRRGQIFSGV
jgi:hypothetical protein